MGYRVHKQLKSRHTGDSEGMGKSSNTVTVCNEDVPGIVSYSYFNSCHYLPTNNVYEVDDVD